MLTIKMLLPTLDNQVGILIDDRLNFLQVICLYLLLYKQCELTSYFWHISISIYSDCAKIGIIFDTNNFFAKKKGDNTEEAEESY